MNNIKYIVLDHSTIQDYKSCPSRFIYMGPWGYTLPKDNASNMAADFGTAIHEGLAHFFRGFCFQSSLNEAKKKWQESEALLANTVPDKRYSLEHMEVIFSMYEEKYLIDGKDRSLKVDPKYVEIPLSFEICRHGDIPVIYKGTIDAAHFEENAYHIIDNKTSGSINMFLRPSMSSTFQFLGYAWLMQKNFPEFKFKGAVINAISTNLSDLKPTTKGEPFERFELSYQPKDLEVFEKDVSYWASRILLDLQLNEFGKNKGSCRDYNKNCPIYEHCNNHREMSEMVNSLELVPNDWDGASIILSDDSIYKLSF